MRLFLAGTAVALLSSGLYADDMCCEPETCSIISVGGSYTRSHIKPKGLSDFDGNMGGVQGMYQYQTPCCVYLAIGGYWRTGKNSGSSGVRDLMDAGVHERIGYTFSFCDFLVSPYTGFGYRHLAHHVKPKVGNKIRLRYNEFYIPVGLTSMYDFCNWLSIGLNGVWMPQVYSTVTFNVADGARWVTESTYKNFNVSLPFYFHVWCDCKFSVVVNPFFEYWQDGKTIAKTQFNDPLGIPRNTYTFWGVELNLQYAF